MSKTHVETIACPRCGHENLFTAYDNLDAKSDPTAKNGLFDMTLFQFQCTSCGHSANVIYNMLYVDHDNHDMIYFVSEQDLKEATRMMDHSETAFGFGTSSYRKRIVTDLNSLREKAIIFDCGLDDRVIEIVKSIYLTDARKQFPDANIESAYFYMHEDQPMFEFVGDTPLTAAIDVSLYAFKFMQYGEKFASKNNCGYVINNDWVNIFLNKEA